MRIIKFRIWCKVSNKYHYNWTKHVEQTDDDLLVWEQFTGLLDKEDREIYEGDILHYSSYEYLNDNVTGYVIFDEGSFLLKVSNSDIRACIGDENTQIVGNIHETPNLLN